MLDNYTHTHEWIWFTASESAQLTARDGTRHDKSEDSGEELAKGYPG